MKKLTPFIALAALTLSSPMLFADLAFDTHFSDKTLRFDYYHTGTAQEEHFAFDQIVQDGPWAGSQSQLIDDLRLGKYLFEVRDKATGAILSVADQTTTEFLFNGNDAVILRKGGENGPILDRIGEVGFDPGAQWGSGLISTQNATLRKRPSVVTGDTSAFEDFEPNLDPVSGDWDGFPQDTFDGLGFHATN